MKNRAAIVTGGLQGIGLAIATELSRQGASVAIGARRGSDENLASEVRKKIGNPCFVAALNVCEQASIDIFLSAAQEFQGKPDILVNAAGITLHQTVDGHSDEDWDSVIDTNLTGPFRMIRSCISGMKARKWGRIVNIASTAARVGEANHPAYCASKAGLVGLTRAVAQEGAPHGVTCVSISPGWVETEMMRESAQTIAKQTHRDAEVIMAEMAASNPLKRLIQPEEIAGIVSYCCSDAARGLTMEDIQVNAGALW